MSFLIIGFPVLIIGIAIIFLMSKKNPSQSNRYKRSKTKKKYTEPKIYPDTHQEQPPYHDEDPIIEAEENLTEENIEHENEEPHFSESSEQKSPAVEDQFIVLYLSCSENRPYTGYELLQTLLTHGLRYGKRNIFHRHEQKTGRGNILFSIASAKEPGTFDLQKMGGFSSPALVLFMLLNGQKDPMKSFELVLETADHLIEDLGGTVLDEKRQPLTKEKMVSLRKKIRLFLEKQKTADLFEIR